MAISIGGQYNIGEVQLQSDEPVARNLNDVLQERYAEQEAQRNKERAEKKRELPVDHNRPIFNSIIDRKENSRYMLDLIKV